MAQLKDTLITGDLRVTGTIYGINNNAADADHTHGNIQNGGTLQTNDVTIATGDKLVITDSSDGHKIARASISFNTSSTTSFLRNDGTWATPQNTTYTVTVTGTGNTITNIGLSGTTITATKGTHTHSKADITDFPTTMTPSSHAHGNIQNGGTLQTNDVTIATGDKLVITDSSDSNKVARASISFNTSSTTSFLRNDGIWATPVGTTYTVTVTGTGNAITNIGLSGTTITATKGSSFAASAHTHSKADITDFPTSMTPSSHAHGDISNTGTLSTTAVTPASGDYIVISDSSNSHKIQRGIAIGTTTTSFLANDGTWKAVSVGSHTHGNIQNGGTLQTNDVTIATGDKLVITDSSDSNKVARASITFNTSSTTSFLRNDGKWATPVDNDTITTWYGTSSTAATTTAKTSAITGFALATGAIATISFSTANTITNAAITLNINSTGAKTIYLDNGATSATNNLTWDENTIMTFVYNGTGYVLVNTTKPIVAQIVRW